MMALDQAILPWVVGAFRSLDCTVLTDGVFGFVE